MKFTDHKIFFAIIPAFWLIACSEPPVEEVVDPQKPAIPAPTKVKRDTPADIVASTDDEPAPTEDRPERGKGGKGGKGDRPDWRNMSEDERTQARRDRIAQMDTNGDGQIGKDEMPERAWEFIGRADKDGDDRISEAEGREFRAEMEAERAIRELSGEDVGGRGFGRPSGGGPGGGGDGSGKGKGGDRAAGKE